MHATALPVLLRLGAALPMLLVVLACIDIVRSGRPWTWFLLVFCVPVAGPILYFLLTRFADLRSGDILAGLTGEVVDSRGSLRQQRKHAAARLVTLQSQLANWRGPAILVEAGEELLTLGRFAEAEAHFREARTAGASIQDAGFGLAQSLVAQGRLDEAVPVLQELVAVDPDHAMGSALLLLARSLDRLDRHAEAEAALREVLKHRNTPEARVRLGRLMVLRGEDVVGRGLARDAVADVALMGRGLRRLNARWARIGKKVAAGDTKLPKTELLDARSRRSGINWLRIGALALLCLVVVIVVYFATAGFPWNDGAIVDADVVASSYAHVTDGIDRLDALPRFPDATPATIVVTSKDVDDYIRLRRRLDAEVPRIEPSGLTLIGGADAYWPMGMDFVRFCHEASIPVRSAPILIAAIDGRFLGRREARIFELPPSVRTPSEQAAEQLIVAQVLGFDPAPDDHEIVEAASVAPPDTTLDPATRAVLESRRADLEALGLRGIRVALGAMDEIAAIRAWKDSDEPDETQ